MTIWLDRHSVNIPRCSWPFEQDQYISIQVKVSCVELEIAYAFAFVLNLHTLVEQGMSSIGSFRALVIYSCLDKGCPTKACATMPIGIMGSKSLALLYGGSRCRERRQEKFWIHGFLLFPSTR